jgi:signal transduction histidine kinase
MDPTLGGCGWIAAGLAGVGAAASIQRRARITRAVMRTCHELRGPLTATRLAVALAARDRELAPSRHRAIEVELDHAALALDDLGEVSGRLPRRREYRELELRQLLLDSVEAWRGLAERRGVALELSCHESLRVCCDRLRIGQALGNLIANAIEHGGGPVRVRGSGDDSVVRIEVRDRGRGLCAPVAELVRRSRRGRGLRGHGLGVAAQAASDHGGRLASAPSERGARLVLELPGPAASPASARRTTRFRG